MNLVLCGMMGAGKTTIGVKIAELTGRKWYDTDGVISNRYGKISDIFEFYGETHFRKIETEIVKELSKLDNLIVSTGGGLVLKSNCNRFPYAAYAACHQNCLHLIPALFIFIFLRLQV